LSATNNQVLTSESCILTYNYVKFDVQITNYNASRFDEIESLILPKVISSKKNTPEYFSK